MNEQKAIVPLDIEPPAKPEPKPVELAQVEARTISKFAEASMIEYSEQEKQILFAPVNVADIKIRPDGQIYLEWIWFSNRLNEAFGQGQWAIEPAPWNPRLSLMGNITYREYVLWIRGQYAGTAVGHHEEQRKTANFGDAAEATRANALMRCCKRLGMAHELWTKDCIEAFKLQMKKQSSDKGRGEAAVPTASAGSLQVDSSGPPSEIINHYQQCKDNLECSSTIDELKKMWAQALAFRSRIGEKNFVHLEVLKNKRKAELAVTE